MEYLLHYVWQQRLYGLTPLVTSDGQGVEVIHPGVHNLTHSGPDFFNAKIKIDGLLWAGNIEIHERSSDWYRHHHETNPAYNNVVLHVCGVLDREVFTSDGRCLPQIALSVPERVKLCYRELLDEEYYPPCYRIIPEVDEMTVRTWMSRLTVERMEEKTGRIENYLERTGGDWERVAFITLARNFGFGTNAQAFEQWALTILPTEVGKHRDDPFQVEAFFLGQAGLLEETAVKPERRDDYFQRLQAEYRFLRAKFNLTPVDVRGWRFGRLRPQNFPHVRLSQLARLYSERRVDLSRILETEKLSSIHDLFRIGVTPYWRTHYNFGETSPEGDKILRKESLNLLVINTVAPLLFAYGKQHGEEQMTERALVFLEEVPAERNYIIRCWERAGLKVTHAADSQALIRLRQQYCDRKDCLRCRFGAIYLKSKSVTR